MSVVVRIHASTVELRLIAYAAELKITNAGSTSSTWRVYGHRRWKRSAQFHRFSVGGIWCPDIQEGHHFHYDKPAEYLAGIYILTLQVKFVDSFCQTNKGRKPKVTSSPWAARQPP